MHLSLVVLLLALLQPHAERNPAVERAAWGRCGHGAVAVGGTLYLVGGIDTDGAHKALSRVDVYDGAARTWSTAAPLPTPRVFAGVCGHDGIIHVVGGISDADVAAKRDSAVHECYDTARKSWRTLAPLPGPRSRFPLVGAGGKLYAIGGLEWAEGQNRDTARVDIYDPEKDTWSRGPDLPLPRHAHAACAVGGRILVAGGYSLRDTLEPLARCDFLDTTTGGWTPGPVMNAPRAWFACVVLDGCVIALGGDEHPDQLCPPLSAWKSLDVPDLSDRRFAAAVVGTEIFVTGGERDTGCRVFRVRASE